jgi:drug/metabolite transporter (DMT)-like permease
VSVALPLTALEYVIVAVLGIQILKEAVPPLRWAGIALVVAGVILIGLAGGADRRPGVAPPPGESAGHEQTPR